MHRGHQINRPDFCFSFVLFLLFTLTVNAQSTNPQLPASKSWAVVIGISKYPKLPGGYQLSFADKDALGFAEAIKRVCGENVRTFINQEATVPAIKEAVGSWLARSTTEVDTVYIFFSGHGYFETEYGEAYLLAYDSDATVPFATALSLKDLSYAISRRVHARKVLFIADAVRKDYFDPEKDDGEASKKFSQAFNQIAEARSGVSTILANRGGEFSREGQRWEAHGVFTKYLLDAMAGGADKNSDGLSTGEEVFDFLSPRVAADTSNKQRPTRSGGISEIALVRANTITAKTPSLVQTPELKKADNPRLVAKADESQTPKLESPQPVRKPEEQKLPPQIPPSAKSTSPVAQPVNTEPNQPASGKVSPPAKANETALANSEVHKPPLNNNSKPSQPVSAPNKVENNRTETPKVAPKPLPSTPTVQPVASANQPRGTFTDATIKPVESAPPPAPAKTIPRSATVSAEPVGTAKSNSINKPNLPTSEPAAVPPSPLALELDSAISNGRLVEPKGDSAWDLYQRLNQQPANAGDALRFKPRLTEALINGGKEMLRAFALGDSIADRTDDFKRAGQMFLRARTLTPDNNEVAMFEKLSAAQALIALQFYDEAEKALLLLPKSELTENAFGLVYTGRLDYWKAERAFRNAIEIKADWAAPYYNLGLLYRMQKKAEALAEFEQATKLDVKTVAFFIALGDEYFSQSKWQPAAEVYRKAVALKPNDDTLHTKLGHALYSQGLRDEANREYQKAKELRNKQ